MIFEYDEFFCLVENICIHIFLVLFYTAKNLNCNEIYGKLKQLINEETDNIVREKLGIEYSKYVTDLNLVRNKK